MDYQPYTSLRAATRRVLPVVPTVGIETSSRSVQSAEATSSLPPETSLPHALRVETSEQDVREGNSALLLHSLESTATDRVSAELEPLVQGPPCLAELSASRQVIDDSVYLPSVGRVDTSATAQVGKIDIPIEQKEARVGNLPQFASSDISSQPSEGQTNLHPVHKEAQKSEEPSVQRKFSRPENPSPNADRKKAQEDGQSDLGLFQSSKHEPSPDVAQDSQPLDSRGRVIKVETQFSQVAKPGEPYLERPTIPAGKTEFARKPVQEELKANPHSYQSDTSWKKSVMQPRPVLPTLLVLYGVKDNILSNVKLSLTQEYEYEAQYFQCAEWNREGLDSSLEVRVWTIKLDPAAVRRRARFQLQIETPRLYGLYSNHAFERNKAFRSCANDSLPNFLFGVSFENSSSECKPVPEPALQLVYFALYLFRGTDYKVTVPQLILQFQRTFRAPFGVPGEAIKGIHRKLNALVTSGNPDLSEALVCCIFGVLGLLKPSDLSKNEGLATHAVLLSCINDQFLRQCTGSEMTSSVLRSLQVHILTNYTSGGLEWKSAFTALQHSDQFEDLVRDVLKDVPLFKSAQVTTWLEVIRHLPSRQSCVCLEEILRKNPDFGCTVQVVQALLCNVSERDQRRSWIQSCLSQTLGKRDISVAEVRTVLDALKGIPPNAKEVFYTLSGKITALLSVKKGLPDTPETIDLLRRLLVLEFDQRLVTGLDQSHCIELLIRVHGFSFASVTSHILPPTFDLSTLCKVWLDGIPQMYDPDQVLKTIDAELFKISVEERVRTLVEMAVQKLLTRLESRGRSYLDLVTLCDSIQTKHLQNECLRVIEQRLKNQDFRFQVQTALNSPLSRLIHDCDKHPKSPALSRLLTFCLRSCEAPTEEEVTEKLLKSPENEACLILLLKHYPELSSEDFPMMNAVLGQVQTFGRKIIDHTIIVNQLIRIQSFTETQKEAFVGLITTAFRLTGIELVASFESSVLEVQKLLKQKDEQLSTFSGFLAHVAVDMIGREALDQDLRNYVNDYKTRPLAFFELPEIIGQLMQTAEMLHPLFHSGLFKLYMRNVKARTEFSLATVQALTTEARTQMFTFLDSLLVSIDDVNMSQILQAFSLVEDPKKEVMIINEVKPELMEKTMRLYKCLSCHKKREELIDRCQMLIHLQELLNLSDEQMLKQVDSYLKKIAQEGDLKVAAFIALTEDTETLLYHQGNRSESVAAFKVLKEMQDLVFLQFLNNLNQVQIDNLIENVFNYDEAQLTTQVVLDLKNVWNFYTALKAQQQTYIQLVVLINSKLQDPQFRLLIGQLQQCKVHFKALQELFINVERNEEAKKQQIISVVKGSKFSFGQTQDKGFDAEVVFETKRENRFCSLQILELRDRARLTIRTSRATSDDRKDMAVLESFVSLADVMEGIVKTLNDLHAFGYPENLAADLSFACTEGQFDELKQFSRTVIRHKTEWEQSLSLAYERNHLLTFFSGEQFWVLERYLLHNEGAKKANSLLGFIGRSVSDPITDEQRQGLNPSERLQFLGKALSRLPKVAQVATTVQYVVPILASINAPLSGILYVESNKPLHALVSVYLHSGRHFPNPHQVMYCSRKTPWAELQAFVYRCFTSPIPGELYTLVECDHLSQENQTHFIEFFRRIFSQNADFSLAVITNEANCPLAKFIQCMEAPTVVSVRENQIINDDEVMRGIIQQLDQSTTVVTSSSAGLGKSRWISSQVKGSGETLVVFPIAGDIHLDQLCVRFLEAVKESTTLHISINYVDNPSLLNDILSSISMFRMLSAGSLLIWFPPSCKVYIEVANLQPSLVHELPYLLYLNRQEVNFQLSDIILESEMSTVCAYLEMYRLEMSDIENPENVGVTKEMCIGLLTQYFANKQLRRGQPLSYLGLKAFLKVLHASIMNMEKGPFGRELIGFTIEELNSVGAAPENTSLRQTIMKSLLKTTMEVTTKYVRSVLTQQTSALVDDGNEEIVTYECSLAWDQTNHFCMVFVEDGASVCIYRHSEKVPGNIKKLLSTQMNILLRQEVIAHIDSSAYQIEDFSSMNSKDLLDKLQTYCCSNAERLSEKFARSEYVMTPDNFLKMNLIYLRAVSKLPIVIMGETGCGKTSLVRFFVSNVLKEEFRVVNIHAGVTSTQLDSLLQEIENSAEVLEIQELDRESARKRRIWVFFDEFNASDCVGQICEIMCERSYMGRKLHDNIVFIGACNPYRLKPVHMQESEEGIKKSGKYANLLTRKLMHVVKPLPETMIEYVWDFGSLQPPDMKSYISTMLRKMESPELESLFTDLVMNAQEYFKYKEDVSSVSLRDVARFVSLFQWFQEALPQRKQNRDKRFWMNLREYKILGNANFEDVKLSAGLLALCYCYLYRISRREEQQSFLEALSRQAGIDVRRITRVLEDNENDFIARMELPKGTALNKAFRQNVTCMIQCICNRTPLFICGKPGCSKSLAIQAVFASLRGNKSQDPYFMKLPDLIMVPFQGSETSTSEGVENAFGKAKRYLKAESKDILPVVVFDEIGLAEISKHNPLKVLHSLLEVENRDIAFVGVSNWRLDASKMNRALYLARPDPDEEELVFTALNIYQVCRSNGIGEAHHSVIKALAETYSDFRNEQRTTQFPDFYGLRDFYSMVKQVSKALINGNIYDPIQQSAVVKKAIARNFGGMKGASIRFGELLLERFPQFQATFSYAEDASLLDLITENLADKEARFLMLIGKEEVATYVLDRYLVQREQRRVLMGSHMSGDEAGDDYSFKSLSDIMLLMEKGISIILKDMDHIYAALYDLFNQNFTVSGKRRYCRVALGALFNPRCLVHEDFHAIVFLSDDPETLSRTDAPFLNRFEKQSFDLDSLFTERQVEIMDRIKKWVDDLMTPVGKKELKITHNHVFPLLSEDYLKLLVLFKTSEQYSEDINVHNCLLEMLRMAPADVLVLSTVSQLPLLEKQFLLNAWNTLHKSTLDVFLKDKQEDGRKLLVFTYSTEFVQVDTETKCAYFSSFKSKQDLTDEFMSFFKSNVRIFVLDFNVAKDTAHISLAKFVIEEVSNQFPNAGKTVCFLCRLMRNSPVDMKACWFEGWEINMFDDFIRRVQVADILEKTTKDVIGMDWYRFEHSIQDLTLKAYQQIQFKKGDSIPDQESINQHIFSIAEQIGSSPRLIETLKKELFRIVNQSHRVLKDWKYQVLCDAECVSKSRDLRTAIETAVETEVSKVFTVLVFSIEKYQAFRSFFCKSEVQEQLRNIWIATFSTLNYDLALQTLSQSNQLHFDFLLDFPFSYKEYLLLEDLFKLYESNVLDEDSRLVFESGFRAKTAFAQCVQNSKPAFELYLRDMIKIHLVKTLLPMEHESVILQFQMQWESSAADFEGKILEFLLHRNLAASFCVLLDQFTALGSVMCKQEFQAEFSEKRINMKSFIEWIEGEALKLIPTSTRLAGAGGISSYAHLMQLVAGTLGSIGQSYDCSFHSLAPFKFWMKFTSLITEDQTQYRILQDVLEKAQKLDTPELSFVYNSEFIQMVFTLLGDSSKTQVTQFRVFYHLLLIKDNPEQIIRAAQDLSSVQDMWKYSASLIQKITDVTDLHTLHSQISRMSYTCGFDLPENRYIQVLETALVQLTLQSQFSVLLCDALYQSITHSYDTDLYNDEQVFQFVSEHVTGDVGAYPRIVNLYSIAGVRAYLDRYCASVIQHQEFHMKVIDDLLSESPMAATFRVYCMKKIKEVTQFSNAEMQKFLSSVYGVTWIHQVALAEQPNFELDVFQVKNEKLYKELTVKFRLLVYTECAGDFLTEEIKRIESSDDKAAFALAALMQVFTLYRTDINTTRARQWIQLQTGTIRKKFGPHFSSLIECFLSNFDESSCLHLSPESSNEEVHRILLMCGFLIILCAYSQLESPMTSVLFNGRLTPSVNDFYIYGTENEPLAEHLQGVLNNFHTLKSTTWNPNYSKGSANRCSSTCKYVYFILNCGGAAAVDTCPFCGNQIGGAGHVLVSRPGHRNMTDEEAIEDISNSLKEYKANQPKGYRAFSTSDSALLRNISALGYRVLHLFINLSLYFFYSSRVWTEEDMKSVVKRSGAETLGQYFSQVLKGDLTAIFSILNNSEAYLCIYSLLSTLPDFLTSHPSLPTTFAIRDAFEHSFDLELIQPIAENPVSVIQSYKEKTAHADSYSALIDEVVQENMDSYQNYRLLRMIATPTFDVLQVTFERCQLQSQYPLLHFYFQKQADFAHMRCLIPLVNLTNYLLEKFNHMKTREEARTIKMVQVLREDAHLAQLFAAFTTVWNEHGPSDLQLGCHPLENKTFGEDDELLYFLVDSKANEGGAYMSAALTHFSDLQNSLLSLYLDIMKSQRHLSPELLISTAHYPVQKSQVNHIINLDLADPTFLCLYCSINPEYGHGKELCFDFASLEAEIINGMGKAKFLDSTDLDYIQYQFELLNLTGKHSALVSNIRNRYPQQNLTKEMKGKVERMLRDLRREDQTEYAAVIRSVYSSLEYLLCFLQNAKCQSTASILEFCSSINSGKVDKYLKDPSLISVLPISTVVELYELFEAAYFPYMKDSISAEFRVKESEYEIERLSDRLIRKETGTPHCSEVHTALRRLIMRCLVGEIKATESISTYLLRPDFWREDIDGEETEALRQECGHLPLSVILPFYEHLERRLNLH